MQVVVEVEQRLQEQEHLVHQVQEVQEHLTQLQEQILLTLVVVEVEFIHQVAQDPVELVVVELEEMDLDVHQEHQEQQIPVVVEVELEVALLMEQVVQVVQVS
jgi:hypothetical protein